MKVITSLRKYSTPLLLSFIVITALVLRIYNIHEIPVSLYWDEAASTYNAYSIAETGKDEYGTRFPLLFRSFDDYKMSGNIYLTAILIKIFGLNEFSARASSALLGTATVFLAFLLVRELFESFGKKNERISPTKLGLLTAGLLAISPWHIQFSRTGFEANVGVFFIVLGMWLFLKGLKKHWYFYVSMATFAVSIYFYRSIHVFLPLFLLGSFFVYRKEILALGIKKMFTGTLIFLLIALPLTPWILSHGGLARVRQVNFMTETKEKVHENAVRQLERDDVVGKIVYNRRVVYTQEIIGNYLSHFSPQFLFFSGDGNGRHGPLGMGIMYLWELPFLLVGLYGSLKLSPKIRTTIFLWILIAPIAASLSVPSPHALRSLNMLPMPQLLTALGLLTTFYFIHKNYRKMYIGVLCMFAGISFIYYLHLYYNINAKATSREWADGYKQLTSYVFANEDKYEKVIISGHYWQPYIYFLFYKAYDPVRFQKSGNSVYFDKYYFGGTGWDKDKGREELGKENLKEIVNADRVLVVLSPEEYKSQKDNVQKLNEIRDHNNQLVFIVGELK